MPLSSLVIRRALHAGAFAAIVGVMAVTPLTPVDAQKGKPPAPQNLELTFANREGDLITSDGGSYFNGQDGVSASINSSSGDLTVSFSTSRHINVALGTPLAGSTEPVAGVLTCTRLVVCT